MSATFMQSVVTETRNLGGTGVTKTQQVVLGWGLAEKKGPSVRLSKAERRRAAARSLARSARRFVDTASYNYFTDCRRTVLKW